MGIFFCYKFYNFIKQINFFIMFYKYKLNNLESIVEKLNLEISTLKLSKSFKLHPDYPSLNSLSDVLIQFGIDNVAIKISLSQISDLTLPIVSVINDDSGDNFVIFQKITNDKIIYYHTKKGVIEESLNYFNEKWLHVVLVINAEIVANQNTRIENFANNLILKYKRNILFLFLLFSLLYVTCAFDTYLESIAWIFANLGLFACFLLLQKQFGYNDNTVSKAVCKTDDSCKIILDSKISKFFKNFSLAEIGFCYLCGIVLSWLGYILTRNQNLISSLFLALSFSFPVSCLLLFYQWKTLKTICNLCMIVQISLFFQFGILFIVSKQISILNTNYLYGIYIFLVPIFFWLVVKPYFIYYAASQQFEATLMSFKYNKFLFLNYLKSQDTSTVLPTSINIGNKLAPIKIQVITNPICKPCSDLHKELQLLMKQFPDYFEFQFILIGGESSNDIINYLLNLKNEKFISALGYWFENKDFEKLKTKYKVADNFNFNINLNINKKWAIDNRINETPSIFVNNYKLNSPYELNDLRLNIFNLIENLQDLEV